MQVSARPLCCSPAVDEAHERGFRVLSARSAAAESVLAYAVLADLLRWVRGLGGTFGCERLALDRALLRDDADGPATDQLEVAAGFMTVVGHMAEASPVLLAVDDLQWLDSPAGMRSPSSRVGFAGRVGLLGAVRPDTGGGDERSWLQLSRPDAIARITVSPLNLGGLHAVVSERLGRSFPRPAMVRI